MLNLLKKTTPWMVASLLVATSVSAQDNGSCQKPCAPKCEPKACPPKPCTPPCPQPCPPTQVCPGQDPCCPPWSTPVLNAAYNYPARTQVRCPWDMYFDASFIYWQPIQENMEVCFNETNNNVTTLGFSGNFVNMSFDYKPGFKVGMGGYFDYDNWDMGLEYTWFHNTQSQSTDAVIGGGGLYQIWGSPSTTYNVGQVYNSVSEKWTLKMDIAELTMGRWAYVGTKLTFRPSFGARAAWIRQDVSVTGINDGTLTITPAHTTANYNVVKGKTRSWAIGPQVGLDMNWMIGYGFRFYGDAEVDTLFTKYTKGNTSITNYANASGSGTATTDAGFRATQKRIYSVRTHLDLEMGFGWGTYLDCNNWYMDFSAGYGFQAFFDQNMFRHFNDDTATSLAHSRMPNGNLYVQGLTVKFELDF